MTAQPDLFGTRHREPPSVPVDTSQDAAKRIKPSAASLRAKVLAYIVERGALGATEQEVEIALGLTGNTCRPRCWELARAGLIVKNGAKRLTKAGRWARVYVGVW